VTKLEARVLALGLYRLHWHTGGSSLASVGQLHDGTRWFAPCNWTSSGKAGIASTQWSGVMRTELILDLEDLFEFNERDYPTPEPESPPRQSCWCGALDHDAVDHANR
jgi:hypothetical protein